MSDYGIWKTIKIGFWLGIGFIIPQMIVMYGGTVLTFLALPTMLESSMEDMIEADDTFDTSDTDYETDRRDQIEIGEYEDRSREGQLLILGSLTNKGEKTVSSIQLEAELFDADGKFLYECTEYISNKIMSGETENFQVKCGCKDSQIPEYKSIQLRVVGAHGF